MNDGLLEVVAIDNLDLAILHAGGMYFLRIETVKTSFVEPLLIFYNINQIYCGFFKEFILFKGSGASVCQCREAKIRTKKPVPMQVDGEPCLMPPCTIQISTRAALEAKMLARNKNATCKYHFFKEPRVDINWRHFSPFKQTFSVFRSRIIYIRM